MENIDRENWLKSLWGPPIPAQENHEESPRRKRFKLPDFSKKSLMTFIILLIVGASIVAGVLFYNKYKSEVERAKEVISNDANDVNSLVEKIGQFVELPQDETPNVATVTDVEKLSGQSFFARAQNGDKVIIYTQAKHAILYRPSTNKVIEVTSLLVPIPNDSSPKVATSTPAIAPREIPTATPKKR